MAKPARLGEVNKSQVIRDLLTQNPKISAGEVAQALAKQGLKVSPNLFYFIKGKMKGRKSRRRKMRRQVATVMGSNGAAPITGSSDILATIKKVKGLASEVGGLKKLKALVDVLSE